MFCRIIGIKIQISTDCLEKPFCKKLCQAGTGQLVSIAYKRHIYNPVQNLK